MVKLDLACGQNKKDGFTGVDKFQAEGVDIVHDLLTYPWPFEDNSVDEVFCSHFFEHIPGKERPRFMEELWRVLKPGASAMIIVPPWNSERAYQDFTHEWPPITPPSMMYFSKDWREAQKLTHGDYDIKCNFSYKAGSMMHPDWKSRTQDVQEWSGRHYINTCTDLVFQLFKEEM